jgi:serine phosphatase RsbU (regulator of sigma subunit)
MDAKDEISDRRRLAALEATALLDTPTERVFDRLTEMAAVTLGVPIALISLVTDDRQFFKSQCGLPAPVATARETPLSHSFCQHVVQDRAPLVIEDARENARVRDNLAIPDLGAIAYAGVPLTLPDGQVIGSFCAIDTSPHRWREADIELLNTLAETTMEIVGLRAEAVEAVDVGRRLQAALVPEPPPIDRAQLSALYRPGERRLLLGGDFYLVTQTARDEVSLLIGDVAGHGPEAAAFAVTLRSAWRTMLLAPAPLEVMVARLNVIALDQQPDPSLYATALVCSISAERDLIEICSAGHPPPVLMDADGAAHEATLLPGPPLGVFGDGRWQTSREPLDHGTSVLVYTAGRVVGGAAPGPTARLGIDRLLEQLPRLQHVAGVDLLAELADHAQRANGAPLSDDVAALLLTLQ